MKYILLLAICITSLQTAGAELFPMQVGDEWIYTIRSTYPGCPGGDHNSVVLQEKSIAGRMAFEVRSACAGAGSVFYSVRGESVDMEYQGVWYRILEPRRENHTWTEFRTTATWKEAGSITVPAGTFHNCWRKTRNVTYTDWYEFCPGAGLVRSHMVDLVGGYIDFELKAFHREPLAQ